VTAAQTPQSLTALVWSPSRVPATVVAEARALERQARVVEVANGTAWLPLAAGWSTPVDVSAADPAKYAAAVPAAAALAPLLRPGSVVLAAGEARLRKAKVGDLLHLTGLTVRVAVVVPNALIGDAEMLVTPADGERLGLPPDRYLLVRPLRVSAWAAESAALRRADPAGVPLRLVAPDKARVLREADEVLSPLEEKLRYGELVASAHTSGGALTLDPTWLAAHITTASVPILGRVTCNRAFLPALREALAAVVAAGLQRLVDTSDYGGCFNGRLIAGQPGTPISHHAYGSAIDLNVRANPDGVVPHQDPRLVRIFTRYGFSWGGSWLVPDGMHFETLTEP
jgi:hypothetical protein